MAVRIDVDLSTSEIDEMAAIPSTSWFTSFEFRNSESPVHPNQSLAVNNEMKQKMVSDWITNSVKGKRVLDLFSANGGFSLIAALAGAKEVVGVEYSQERIQCAEFVVNKIRSKLNTKIEFIQGDVYDIEGFFDEPFDVVMCLG